MVVSLLIYNIFFPFIIIGRLHKKSIFFGKGSVKDDEN
ncbi:hypothetical protein CLOL250_00842 [Clostridium sp. L2-50]|nr:hypothetical protein CLOL250_00842 [Clostridium sp. L2-50]